MKIGNINEFNKKINSLNNKNKKYSCDIENEGYDLIQNHNLEDIHFQSIQNTPSSNKKSKNNNNSLDLNQENIQHFKYDNLY